MWRVLPVALLSLISTSLAGISTQCVSSDVCYSFNIPDTTVSSGSGDIYIQISGPTTYSWIGIAQGSQMSGSNFFIIYTSSDGQNVTLSPRLSSGGHNTPSYNSAAQASLLEGSGVSNGVMTANIICSNCNSWSGGSMSFSSSTTNWIWAMKSGSSLNTDSQTAIITQHDNNGYGTLQFDSSAQGGTDGNPFLTNSSTANACSSAAALSTSGTAVASISSSSSDAASIDNDATWTTQSRFHYTRTYNSPSSTSTGQAKRALARRGLTAEAIVKRAVSSDCSTSTSSSVNVASSNGTSRLVIVHAVLACFAFAIVFPVGGILIRVMSFPGLLWVHGVLQVVGYLVYIAAFALGVYIATHPDFGELKNAHPIIGLLLVALLFLQGPLGYVHHAAFKRYQKRTIWSHLHLWVGRTAITLGIVNGGLGFKLSNNTGSWGLKAYGAIAGVIWVSYVLLACRGEFTRKRNDRRSSEDILKRGQSDDRRSVRDDFIEQNRLPEAQGSNRQSNGNSEEMTVPQPPEGFYSKERV